MSIHDEGVARTDSPDEACLSIAGPGSFSSWGELQQNPIWNGGRNHVVWMSNEWQWRVNLTLWGDHPAALDWWGSAALCATFMTHATLRTGFDLPVALSPQHVLAAAQIELARQTTRSRKYLLSFKGQIRPWPQPYWQHRWVAAEYLHDPTNGIVIDVACTSPGSLGSMAGGARATEFTAATGEDHDYDYGALLLDSTFVFAPGGGGGHSYRFAEALVAGAVPVVTTDLVLPFEHELPWDACVVRVSEAAIVTLPQRLRQISDAEVLRRREACGRIRNLIFGDGQAVSVHRHQFTYALRVWALRMRQAAERARLVGF
jgi:hypothetical protein